MHTSLLGMGEGAVHRLHDVEMPRVRWKQLGLFSQKQRVPNLSVHQKIPRGCVNKNKTDELNQKSPGWGPGACIL